MKKTTKLYFKNLVDDLEIEVNTIETIINDIQKIKRKLKQFDKKIIQKV